jgi:hypothetical protein
MPSKKDQRKKSRTPSPDQSSDDDGIIIATKTILPEQVDDIESACERFRSGNSMKQTKWLKIINRKISSSSSNSSSYTGQTIITNETINQLSEEDDWLAIQLIIEVMRKRASV